MIDGLWLGPLASDLFHHHTPGHYIFIKHMHIESARDYCSPLVTLAKVNLKLMMPMVVITGAPTSLADVCDRVVSGARWWSPLLQPHRKRRLYALQALSAFLEAEAIAAVGKPPIAPTPAHASH